MDKTLSDPKGVTLLELLIALVISSILVGAMYYTLIRQQKAYIVQEQVVDMQQNVRIAINRMMREIRMGGFGTAGLTWPVTVNGHSYSNIVNPDAPSGGELTVVCAIGEPTTLKGSHNAGSTSITVNSLPDSLDFDNQDKRLMSVGGVECIQVTALDRIARKFALNGTLTYNHRDNTPVFPIRAISYQVKNNFLRRSENTGGGFQPLANNVDNVQFEYFNASGNQIVFPGGNPGNITVIRVTVTARTDKADPEFRSDSAGFRKRTITSNIRVRNMGL